MRHFRKVGEARPPGVVRFQLRPELLAGRRGVMNRRARFLIGALLCALVTTTATAAELITLRYGQNATSAGILSSLPLTVAERKGFFVR